MKTYKPNYKFRGKYKETGEIVYGSLLKIPNANYIIDSISWNEYYDTDNKYHKIIFQDSSTDVTYHTPLRMYAVEKDSIAQLIGYDKNFKEIYEDDYLIDITNGQIVYALEVLKKEYSFCDIFSRYIVKESD